MCYIGIPLTRPVYCGFFPFGHSTEQSREVRSRSVEHLPFVGRIALTSPFLRRNSIIGSKATLGKLLRQGGAHIFWAFRAHDTDLN